MTRALAGAASIAVLVLAAGCSDDPAQPGDGATAAMEAETEELNQITDWTVLGDDVWTMEDGEIVGRADAAASFLVSPRTYDDVEISLEFWINPEGNSGVFLRCQNAGEITDTSCYEANIFDNRPDQSGRTGAIVHIAPPMATIDAGGQWNTYVIRAEGEHLSVVLNGEQTVDVDDDMFGEGVLALQVGPGAGPGEVRFRNVKVREL